MNIPSELIVPVEGFDTNSLLTFWRWLVSPDYRVLFGTALGDLFLQSPNGSIYWLNVGVGELEEVAPTLEEFEETLNDEDNLSMWFGPNLVGVLRFSEKVLQKGECYSYMQLPILGGDYMPSNFEVCDLVTHLNKWGPVQEMIHDHPDGTTVSFEVTE